MAPGGRPKADERIDVVIDREHPVQEILDVARNEKAGLVTPRVLKLPAVDALSAKVDEAWRKSCGTMTLRDLLDEG
jgi:hypothetical protein